jgi:hypothetical protein
MDFVADINHWRWHQEEKLRKEICSKYTMSRSDFPSEDDYNAFLEDREEMSKLSLAYF